MKRLIFIASLLLVGCSDPQPKSTFNPNYKHIVMIEGEYFRVPYGSSYRQNRYNQKDMEKIDIYKQYGLVCKIGDIIWANKSIGKKVSNVMKKEGKLSGYRYMGSMFAKGNVNCESPLSQKEYRFYRGKEMENNADSRARYNAMTSYLINRTPQNVYMNHSGSINHNIRYGY